MLDNSDVDLFLNDIEEDRRGVQPVASDAQSEAPASDGQADQNLSHFVAFLSKHKKKSSQSKRAVALERYERQKVACPSGDEKELADLAKFRKIA